MPTNFCGWYGRDVNHEASYAAALVMVQHVNGTAGKDPFIHTGPGAALAANGDSVTGTVLADATLRVAIAGTPHWSAAALQALAERDGPAAAAAQAYRRAGVGLLENLHGRFAVAIIDAPNDLVLLATDRMGAVPVYYAEHGGDLAFGTTAASIQAHPAFHSSISVQALYNYLFFHVVPSPQTIFQRMLKLQPAQYLLYRSGRADLRFYWNPEFGERAPTSLEQLGEELRWRLRNAVNRHRFDPHSGAFLSGGLDSSTVAGLLREAAGAPIKTFSIGFDTPGYNEMDYARRAARHFATEPHEYYVTPHDVVNAVSEIARAYDEPFGNSSAVPVYYCARLAKENGVSTLLAGDGGDELFGGNTRYAKQNVFEWYGKLPAIVRRRLLEPLLFAVPAAASVALLRKVRSYVEQASAPMPERLETYNFLRRVPPREVLHADLVACIDPDEPLRALGDTYTRARAATLVDRMLFLDWKFTLADNDLRKVNRMCELAGVAVHYPMLDDDLVEFSTRIPADLKVKGRQLRYLYKHALSSFLPAKIIAKPKHGFGLPFGLWMREHPPLRELAYDSLARLGGRNYVRTDYLARLTKLHRDEHAAYYGEFIWVLMMLELWLSSHGA